MGLALTTFVGNHCQTSTTCVHVYAFKKRTAELFTKHRDANMKQTLEPQLGAGAEDVQYRKLETPVHDQITSRVRNRSQVEAGRATSIEGSYVFLNPAFKASGVKAVTTPSSGSGNPALSPDAITVSRPPAAVKTSVFFKASGVETVTAPSCGSGNPALSPDAITVSRPPAINVLDVD